MLKNIAVIVVLAVVVVLVLAARKPDHFRVQRSASIDVPPERIYAFVESTEPSKITIEVGTDFEAGLANLKTAVEREPARSAS